MTADEAADVLGVTPDTPSKEVVRAYRDLRRVVEPEEVEVLHEARLTLVPTRVYPRPASVTPAPQRQREPMRLVARPEPLPPQRLVYTGPVGRLWTYAAAMVALGIWQIIDALT